MAKAKLVNGGFKPVEILVTLETQEELDMFGSIFNNAKLSDCSKDLEADWGNSIWKEVDNAGGNVDRYLDTISTAFRR